MLDNAESISEGTMDINLKGNFLISQTVGRWLIDNKSPGSIVDMSSQMGAIALDKHVAYCERKGGIIAMTKALTLEWSKFGVHVNAVSPTVVLTELDHKAWGPVGDAFKKEMPSQRFGETG